jgi:DNA-binding MarR family transcriptional regulator
MEAVLVDEVKIYSRSRLMAEEQSQELFPGKSHNEIEELLFHLLRSFYQFERIEVEMFSLSYELIYILKLLKRTGRLSVGVIAREMRIKVFTTTRLIDQLEKKSLVKRERADSDKRNVFAVITPAGKKIIKKIEDHAIKLILGNLSRYSEKEIGLLFGVLSNMENILGIEPSQCLNN